MRHPVGLAVIWSAVFVATLAFVVGGQIGPCPELRPVGAPEMDREAIARMCDARDRAAADFITANRPGSWLVIWGIGVGTIAVVARRAGRRDAPD